jgi:hypothetical protein
MSLISTLKRFQDRVDKAENTAIEILYPDPEFSDR